MYSLYIISADRFSWSEVIFLAVVHADRQCPCDQDFVIRHALCKEENNYSVTSHMMLEKAHFLGWETFFGGWMYFCSLRLSLEELQNNPSFQVGEIRWNYMLVDVFVLYGYLRAWVLHVPWHLIQYPLGWPLSSTGWYQRPQGYKWLRFIVNDWLLNQSKLESQGITCFRGNKLNRKRIQQRKIRCYVKLQTNRERTKNLSFSRFPISAWRCSIACARLCTPLCWTSWAPQ